MRQFVFSAAMAVMLLGGTTFAMATGSGGGGGSDHGGGGGGSDHGGGGGHGGGGSTGGGGTTGGGSTTEKDGAPGANTDAPMQGSAAEECDRLIAQRKIGQSGPASGSAVNLAGRDCDPSGATK